MPLIAGTIVNKDKYNIVLFTYLETEGLNAVAQYDLEFYVKDMETVKDNYAILVGWYAKQDGIYTYYYSSEPWRTEAFAKVEMVGTDIKIVLFSTHMQGSTYSGGSYETINILDSSNKASITGFSNESSAGSGKFGIVWTVISPSNFAHHIYFKSNN